MKRVLNISVASFVPTFLVLLIAVSGPSSAAAPEEQTAAEAVNAFAIDLYGKLRKSEGSLFFSPYSISVCLAMAYAGARGTTESQMAKVLHLGIEKPATGRTIRALNERLRSATRGRRIELNIANALWTEKSKVLLKEYLEAIRSDYQGEIKQVDFRHGTEALRKRMNAWVEKRAKHKIKDLIAPGTVTPDTRMVLTNAVYFKSFWEHQFDKRKTEEAPFTLLDGKQVKAPMMQNTESFGYMHGSGLQVLEMPYEGDEMAMVILLPSKERPLEEFERSITGDRLAQWIQSLQKQKVETHLPRFKITHGVRLSTMLTGLGMSDAFSADNADFSGMTGRRDLFIGDAVHKAFVDVNEEGTEAAAATGVHMRGTGMARRPPIFRADHPFVFIIRHKPSGCILFLGRMTGT